MGHVCPVCGHLLKEPPYDPDGNPSYEICDCCGFQFGFDDQSEGWTFEVYRASWLKTGAFWFSERDKPDQ